jgi:hypothetical protein
MYNKIKRAILRFILGNKFLDKTIGRTKLFIKICEKEAHKIIWEL